MTAAAMTVGSLFSGIGGLDLGLERAGMRIIWQCEIDPFKRRILAKHWPQATRYEDVRHVDWPTVPKVKLLAGGFPCNDTSDAGQRAGIEGEHSRLWAHFADAVRVIRPRHVLVENSTGLLARGMGRVVGDLAASGYDVEWDCLPAAAFGASHLRARLFLVAHSRRVRSESDNCLQAGWPAPVPGVGWLPEPDVGRVADGIPSRLDRARVSSLGNAVVPQVAEWIGRRIMETA